MDCINIYIKWIPLNTMATFSYMICCKILGRLKKITQKWKATCTFDQWESVVNIDKVILLLNHPVVREPRKLKLNLKFSLHRIPVYTSFTTLFLYISIPFDNYPYMFVFLHHLVIMLMTCYDLIIYRKKETTYGLNQQELS